MAWNPEQYLKFAQPRLRPAIDLLARIDAEHPAHIYDLGCGTGSITQLMAERWPGAQITGVDDSAEMLGRAATAPTRITWVQQNLASWAPAQPANLIFSNSALHWLPNHERLLPALVARLAPGGTLAVQMPRNFAAPSHTLIAETARSGVWRSKLEHLLTRSPVAEPQFYYSLLHEHSASLDIWETEYLHVLEGKDAVKEWTKGTWLKRFLDALDEPQRGGFETEYARRVNLAYPPLPNGQTLFPFRRLFILLKRR
jgi:trans-aconitate 2-methyltransferase